MLGAMYSEWIKSTHNLFVIGNTGNEKTEKIYNKVSSSDKRCKNASE